MKSTSRQTVLFFWHSAWKYPKYVIGAMIAVPLTTLVSNFLPPLILANVLSRLSKHDFQPHNVWASFGPSLVEYTMLVLLSGTVTWRMLDWFAFRLEGVVLRDMAREVYSHLLNQSSDFHANHFGGSLVSQTNKLIGSYIRISDTTWFQVLPMIWSLLFVMIILAHRAPLYVIILIGFSLIYITTAFFVTKTVRRLGGEHSSAESIQTGHLSDAVTNVMAIKSFSRKDYEIQRFNQATDTTHSRLLTLVKALQYQQAYFSSMTSLILALSLVMAVVSVVTFNADLATVFLILNYTAFISGQLFSFSNQSLRHYNRALGDASDMITILDTQPDVKDPEEPEVVKINKGSIEFNNVTFKHDGADTPIFNNLSLSIKSGEKIGLVGRSGSGKTTFTRLLLRFSDIDNGEISIDGQNIADIKLDDLHENITYVPQEPLLFHRSIKENISYGKPEASIKEIDDIAKQAHADEFIDKLPMGYETLVGERGVKLSGGQRQRVAIARAMLKNAPILVLDEATSALDSESEVLIQDALWKLMEGRTAVVIAHRLSTIQKMDRIIVLENGKIIEQGSHKELIQKDGSYAKLWAHQSGGFIEE